MKKTVFILTLYLTGAVVPVMASSVEEKPTATKAQTPVTPSSVITSLEELSDDDDDFDVDAFMADASASDKVFLEQMRIAEEEFQKILADHLKRIAEFKSAANAAEKLEPYDEED